MVYLPPLAATRRAHFMDEEMLHGECLIMIIKNNLYRSPKNSVFSRLLASTATQL